MSDLVCPQEVFLHDESASLADVFRDVLAHPVDNLKALLLSPTHQCVKCSNQRDGVSKVSNVLRSIREIAQQQGLDAPTVACAGAIAGCAYFRNGLTDSVLYFLSSIAVSKIVPKLLSGFKLFMSWIKLRQTAATSATYLRRQFLRCILGLLILAAMGGAAALVAGLVRQHTDMPHLSSESCTDLGYLSAAVLLSMFGVASLGRHFSAFLQVVNAVDLREALRNSFMRFLTACLKLIKKTISFFTKSDWARLDWCIASCEERYAAMPTREFEQGVALSEQILNAKGSALGFIGSDILNDNINTAITRLLFFDHQPMSAAQHANVAHRILQLQNLQQESQWVASMSVERTPPTGVMFLGAPGVGKSYCVPLFLEAVHERLVQLGLERKTEAGVYFTRNSDTEFFDGYTGQPFVYYSDMFRGTLSNDVKARESLARELSEIQSLIDTAPYYPPFAFEPTPRRYGKGVAIAPKIVLVTSNYHCVDTLGDSYILGRRFAQVYMFLQTSQRKYADLSHLRIYRKKSRYMDNGPNTGGKPFAGPYTPANQFPTYVEELNFWPWADDWEQVDFAQMVDDVVDDYFRQQGVFRQQRVVNPFKRQRQVFEQEEIGTAAPSVAEADDQEDESCIPLPVEYDSPESFFAAFGSDKFFIDESGVEVHILDGGKTIRRKNVDGTRRLYHWDRDMKVYVPHGSGRWDVVDLRSTGNDCVFAAIQAGGVGRDQTTDELRRRCRYFARNVEPNPFAPGEMIADTDLGLVSEALQVNIKFSVIDKTVIPMNERNEEWPTVHVRYRNQHYVALVPKGTYDGWCGHLGGTLNGQPLIRGGMYPADEASHLLNERRKIICCLRAEALGRSWFESDNIWVVDTSNPRARPDCDDPWVLLVHGETAWVVAPRRWHQKLLISDVVLHEAMVGIIGPVVADRTDVWKTQDYLILDHIDIEVFRELEQLFRLPVSSLIDIYGLYVAPDPNSNHKFFAPHDPRWWIIKGLYADKYFELVRSHATAFVARMPESTKEQVLTPRARATVLAAKDFMQRNKTILTTVAGAVGATALVFGGRRLWRSAKEAFKSDKPLPSSCGNYLLFNRSTLDPPRKSTLQKLFAKLRICPQVVRENGNVAAHIDDIAEFTTRCPDLIAEPVEELDLKAAAYGFKASLYRPNNFPRVALFREGREVDALTGMHLRGGLVMFPAHVLDEAIDGDWLEVHGARFDPRRAVRYPLGPQFDVALVQRAHYGEHLPLDGFAPPSFVEHNFHARDLVEVLNLRDGRPARQVARIADVATVVRNTRHGARERQTTGYLVHGAVVRPGDCGALLIGKGHILGMLTAGVPGGESLWVPLDKEKVGDLIRKYGDEQQPVSMSFAALSKGYGEAEGEIAEPLRGFHFFKQSEKYDKPYQPIRTVLAGALDPEGYWQPAPVSYESYQKALNRFHGKQIGDLPVEVLEAAEDYSALDTNQYHFLPDWKSAANGCTDLACKNIVLKKIVLDSSPGKPFTEPAANVPRDLLPEDLCGLTDKKKLYTNENGLLVPRPELQAMAQKLFDSVKQGKLTRWPFTMALKREIRDAERVAAGKCRLFIMPPHHVNLVMRRVLGDWAGRYKREGVRYGHAMGINAHSQLEWMNLLRYLQADGYKVIAPDFSGYDTSHPTALNQLIAQKVAQHYAPDERKAVRACFLACNIMEFYDKKSYVVRTGQASGSQITTQINCWYSQILFRAALYSLYKQNDWIDKAFVRNNFRIVCYGDDVLLAASPRALGSDEGASIVAGIKRFLAGVGYTITNGDKGELVAFEPATRVRFLKRLFYPTNLCCRAPLPNDSLAKGLVWFDSEEQNFEEYQRSSLRSFMMEMAEQKEEDCLRWAQRLKEAVRCDPSWLSAFEEVGGLDFLEKCRMWKRSESKMLLEDSHFKSVAMPPGWTDAYARSAWCSLPY